MLHYAYCFSRISYGIEVYGTSSKSYLRKIQVVQNRILKTLYNGERKTPPAHKFLLDAHRTPATHTVYELSVSFKVMSDGGVEPQYCSIISNQKILLSVYYHWVKVSDNTSTLTQGLFFSKSNHFLPVSEGRVMRKIKLIG